MPLPQKRANLTKHEKEILDTAILTIQQVLKKFQEANSKFIGHTPTAMCHVMDDNKTWWRVMLTGCRKHAVGATLQEAMNQLVNVPDVGALRVRAQELRNEANRLEENATEIEESQAEEQTSTEEHHD